MLSDVSAGYVSSLLIYDPRTGLFRWKDRADLRPNDRSRLVGRFAGSRSKAGYISIKIDGRLYKAHRLAWLLITGRWPDREVDHRDRNPSNNRWRNLRLATRQQNEWNRGAKKNNISGFRGVSPNLDPRYKTKLWLAHIRENGKQKFIGRYRTAEEAYEAYCRASAKLHGEYSHAA